MKILIITLLIFIPSICFGLEKADLVLVIKSEKTLIIKTKGKVIKQYHVVFGAQPKGHKVQEGDERTPEGQYILDFKKTDSAFYKSIHISYPNSEDKKKAQKLRFNPGGAIMIHGQPNGYGWFSFILQKFNWTDGCIAVKNHEMDEIWESVAVGTPITIVP